MLKSSNPVLVLRKGAAWLRKKQTASAVKWPLKKTTEGWADEAPLGLHTITAAAAAAAGEMVLSQLNAFEDE